LRHRDSEVRGQPELLQVMRPPQVGEMNCNYNDNSRLVEAIWQGYRGAFWGMLEKVSESPGTEPWSTITALSTLVASIIVSGLGSGALALILDQGCYTSRRKACCSSRGTLGRSLAETI
jgi:hypothetical protein